MRFNQATSFCCLIVTALVSLEANAQAMHWLSKPESSLGAVHNDDIDQLKVSANGRYVSFLSSASNIVNGDTNQEEDLFVYDSFDNTTLRVTDHATSGYFFVWSYSAPTSDGEWVSFIGSGNFGFASTGFHLYLKNLNTGTLQQISVDSGSTVFEVQTNAPVLADDGSSVTFITAANLSPVHTSSARLVYRKNLTDNSYTLLSMSEDNMVSANSNMSDFAVSPNMRYVAMLGQASNIVSGTTAAYNLFLRDTMNETNHLVTVQPNGTPSNYQGFTSGDISVSNVGHVAFIARHDDLVANDNNERYDLFLFNGTNNTRINVDSNGQEMPNPLLAGAILSADSTRVVFSDSNALLAADDNSVRDIYAYQVSTETLGLITQQPVADTLFNNTSVHALSANGQNLYLTSQNNQSNSPNYDYQEMMFKYDFSSQEMTHINPVAFDPNTITESILNPVISKDQRWVIYASTTRNLTASVKPDKSQDLYLLDRSTDSHQIIARNVSNSHDISASGRYITFLSNAFQPAGDIDLGDYFVFLYDRITNQYTQITTGAQPKVNNGGKVVFSTLDNLLPSDNNSIRDVYLYNPLDGNFSLISVNTQGMAGNQRSTDPDINDLDSQTWIVFQSEATDLIAADDNGSIMDIFMHPWPGGQTIRVSQTPTLTGGNSQSVWPSVSENGEYVAFSSFSSNLTNDDYSEAGEFQGFVYDRINQQIRLISKDNNDTPIGEYDFAYDVVISGSGRYIAFRTERLLAEDDDYTSDVYLYDYVNDFTQLVSKRTNNQQVSGAFTSPQVVENTDVSPPLVGVVFQGAGGLTEVAEHPGHAEAYLYQQGGPNVELTIEVSGSGTVSGSQGISCSSTCNFDYPLGTQLTLVASPDSSFVFNQWQSSHGQCLNGNNPCQLTMTREKQIEAIFIEVSDVIFNDRFD